jgi:hypothetical protein
MHVCVAVSFFVRGTKGRTKNNFLFSFPLTLPSPARGEGEKAKLFFVRP